MNKKEFKLKDQELILLLILGGVALFVLVFRFVCSPLSDSNRTMKQEIATVHSKTIELKQMAVNEEEYKSRTDELTKEIEDIYKQVPAGIRDEDKVLTAIGIEQDYDFDITEIGMGEDVLLYALNASGQNQADSGKLLCITPMTISCHTSYDGLKDCLRGLKQSGEKMAVNSASFSYDEEAGNLVGTMDIYMYYLVGEGLEYTPKNIDDVSTGTSNIFGRITYGTTSSDAKEDTEEDDKTSDKDDDKDDKDDDKDDKKDDTEKEDSTEKDDKTDTKKN